MKAYFKGVAVQATAIILAALGAAAFTFLQSVAAQSGVCPTPTTSPETAGAIGALFKGIHTALTVKSGTLG